MNSESTLHPVRELAVVFREIERVGRKLEEAIEHVHASPELIEAKSVDNKPSHPYYKQAIAALRASNSMHDAEIRVLMDLLSRADVLADGIGKYLHYGMSGAGRYETKVRQYLKDLIRPVVIFKEQKTHILGGDFFSKYLTGFHLEDAGAIAHQLETVAITPPEGSWAGSRADHGGKARPRENDSLAVDTHGTINRIADANSGERSAIMHAFPFQDDDLTILVELAARGVLTKAADLHGKSGMPGSYDRITGRLRAMEEAKPPLVERPNGERRGYRVTPDGLAELKRRDLFPT